MQAIIAKINVMNLRAETNMTTHSKPWYTRRRYWAVALFAVLVYFCLIPMPLRISPETTGITTLLLPNGNVDYFDAFEQTYIHKLTPPEDNGTTTKSLPLAP